MDEKNASRWALFTRKERDCIKESLLETLETGHDLDDDEANLVEEIDYMNMMEGKR